MISSIRSIFRLRQQKRFYSQLIKTYKIKAVFDIGANVGKKTTLFLENDCRVLALEPNAECYIRLEELKSRYPSLSTMPMALSDAETTLDLHLGNHPEISTLSEKMVREFTTGKKVYWDKQQTVNTITFAQLVKEHFYPDLLKLDCEGWDYVIISSLHQPVKLIEFEFTEPFLKESIHAVNHLSGLGSYVFNFSAYEQSRFMFKTWLTAPQFISEFVAGKGDVIHGNMYALHQGNK